MLYLKDLCADEKASFMAYLRVLAEETRETEVPAPVSQEAENRTDAESQNL